MINMKLCQNPVECQPVKPHIQSSQRMLNISIVKLATCMIMLNLGATLKALYIRVLLFLKWLNRTWIVPRMLKIQENVDS